MQQDPKIIVAVDFSTMKPVRELIQHLSPQYCRIKIGNILFTRYGPKLVEEIMQRGFQVFLDLKYHDIPQTVAGACKAAAELGVWMVNVHIAGGSAMMRAAREAIDKFENKPLLIGVTVLTSLVSEDLIPTGISEPIETVVQRRAKLAKENGLDGVVCSPQEIEKLQAEMGSDFVFVTPGIRLSGDNKDDQKRVMTPTAAIQAGGHYLVIGRSITRAADPLAILLQITAEINSLKTEG